jgi:hypothetical protein
MCSPSFSGYTMHQYPNYDVEFDKHESSILLWVYLYISAGDTHALRDSELHFWKSHPRVYPKSTLDCVTSNVYTFGACCSL